MNQIPHPNHQHHHHRHHRHRVHCVRGWNLQASRNRLSVQFKTSTDRPNGAVAKVHLPSEMMMMMMMMACHAWTALLQKQNTKHNTPLNLALQTEQPP
jgi:hypothetical protein